jgi:hypothetical protein
MPRQTWEQLTPAYRARLERQGIGKTQHEAGASLHKARGKTSQQHEAQQNKINRGVNKFIDEFSRLYGRDPVDVREALSEFPKAQVWAGIQNQQKMQELYHEGRVNEARRLWEMRDQSLPEWMHYYHGYFS